MINITAEELRRFGPVYEPIPSFNNEGDRSFTEQDLDPGYVPQETYLSARASLVRTCADGLVSCLNEEGEYGILLITRKGNPAKDQLWSIGGGIPRGIVGPREALNANAQRECGLKLSNHVYLGAMDFAWATTPGETELKGKGIRDTGLMYYAHGTGDLRFGELDNNPLIVTPNMWERRQGKLNELHPYIDRDLEKAMTLLVDDFYR